MREFEKRGTGTVHAADTLKKLIKENPDLPLVIFAGEEANNGGYSLMACTSAHAEIGEILDCMQEINDEILYTDREQFEDEIRDGLLYDDDNDEKPEEWFEEETKRIAAEYEPYWKRCIILKVDN